MTSTTTRTRVALVTLLLGALLASGCTADPVAEETPDPGRSSTASAPPAGLGGWCASRTDVLCLERDAASGFVVPAEGTSAGLVVWDPGGPGLDLPTEDVPFDLLRPASLDRFDLLVPVEPWLTDPPSQQCLTAAARPAPAAECRLADLASSAAALADLAAAAAQETDQPVVGAYLQSFGATRSFPATEALRRDGLDWVVLESPGPPAGTPARRVVGARTAATLAAFTEACPTRACAATVRESLLRWSTRGVPGEATGREVALGLLAVASLPDDNAPVIDRLRGEARRGRLPASSAGELRRLGRQFEQRDVSAVRPSLIGFWADTCPRLSGWGAASRLDDPLARALMWLYRGCNGEESASTTAGGDPGVPVLLLTGRRDTVVPAALQQAWARRLPDARTYYGDRHFWEDSKATALTADWIARHSTS